MNKYPIKIGGRIYTINLVDSVCDETFSTHDNAYGYVDYINSKITIKNEVSKNYQQENIIHEILHALLDNAGLPEENLDKTIQILTPRIHAFLIDNIEFQKNFLEFEKNEDNI